MWSRSVDLPRFDDTGLVVVMVVVDAIVFNYGSKLFVVACSGWSGKGRALRADLARCVRVGIG
jgi:hypothetical protein